MVSCWLEEAADFIVGACVTEGGAGGWVCALWQEVWAIT